MTGVRFEGLAAAIRIEEKTLAGEPIDELFDKELEAAGNSCGVGNWYFIVRRNEDGVTKGSYMLLNGSDSYPNMAPTKISWERLKEIIISVF